MSKNKIGIVGGGLAGLASAILWSEEHEVTLYEKNHFPFQKMCGEYLSKEALPFLKSIGFNPFDYGAADINELELSSGKTKITTPLPLGGIGISRYLMDHLLKEKAEKLGASVFDGQTVQSIESTDEKYYVKTANGITSYDKLILCQGKRSNLDKELNRKFISQRTHWFAVKYHVKMNYPENRIGLHHFPGGYCGMSRIEDDKYCVCYLANSKYLNSGIKEFEEEYLMKNPSLSYLFKNMDHLWEKPITISQIYFGDKHDNNRFIMSGDSAGLISPLAGNGMAMALHAAKLNYELRNESNDAYYSVWNKNFASRIRSGRILQAILTNSVMSKSILNLIKPFPGALRSIIKSTHGKRF